MGLKEVRLRLGLKQRDIAQIAETNVPTVIRWEAGLERMPLRNARLLSEKYELPLASFRKNPPAGPVDECGVDDPPIGKWLGPRAAPRRPDDFPYGSIRLRLLDLKGRASHRSKNKKHWYVWPISEGERKRVTRLLGAGTILSDAPVTKDWLCLETLDDRLVFVNMAAIESVEFIDDDSHEMPEHESQAAYEFAQTLLTGTDIGDVDLDSLDPSHAGAFKSIVMAAGGLKKAAAQLQEITIELMNGRRRVLPFGQEHAEDLLSSMMDNDAPAANRFGYLSCGDHADEAYYRFGAQRLIEVSRQRWMALMEEARKT